MIVWKSPPTTPRLLRLAIRWWKSARHKWLPPHHEKCPCWPWQGTRLPLITHPSLLQRRPQKTSNKQENTPIPSARKGSGYFLTAWKRFSPPCRWRLNGSCRRRNRIRSWSLSLTHHCGWKANILHIQECRNRLSRYFSRFPAKWNAPLTPKSITRLNRRTWARPLRNSLSRYSKRPE